MNLIKYILLGIIQGITEPLPISSSGHLFIFKQLFSTDILNDLNFEIFLNFASFLAIVIIFWKDLVRLIGGFFSYIFDKDNRKKYEYEFKYCFLIVVGSIPVGVVGFLFKDKIESVLNSTWMVGVAFLITAIALVIVNNIKGSKDDNTITFKDAIIVGLFQMIALFPGLSRSGMTLVGCLLCKLNRESSLKYTFMLYLPVSLGTFILGVKDIMEIGIESNMLINYIVSMIFSGVFTLLTYNVFTRIVRNGKLWKFSIYLVLMGLFVLIYFI